MLPMSALEAEIAAALERLETGEPVLERRYLDLKEEPGRRGRGGVILPGQGTSEEAAAYLAGECACIANTPGGGALVLGVADDGTLIGTELDAEWLRARIFQLLQRLVTPDIREVHVRGVRLLVLRLVEAVEPVRWRHKIRWRVDDTCQEIDAASWHARRHAHLQFDWSAQPSASRWSDVRAGALEKARDSLRDAGDPHSAELADADDRTLLSRLNAIDGEGRLTKAAELVFVGRTDSCLDYVRRDVHGADSATRIRRADRSLIEQLAEVFAAGTAHNPVRHVGTGLSRGQLRQIPERAFREAIINGIAHRDWGSSDPTTVEHVGGTLRVTSPGGFYGGVTTANIITHPSKSRNPALAQLLASLKLAEREGIGVDRLVLESLSAGLRMPTIEETPSPSVVTSLNGEHVDGGWIAFIRVDGLRQEIRDLRVLMSLWQLTRRGWVDAETLAPFLQVSLAEAGDAMRSLLSIRVEREAVVAPVDGQPSTATPAACLAPKGRRLLGDSYDDAGEPTPLPSPATVAIDYAGAQGRISSTELGALTGRSNPGIVLKQLEGQGALAPSWPSRRGQGFHYLPARA
ncbi:hypothetical protein USB125703_00768 [Pseudoclavibacter triregionum]|nr:hypothetical protein USB125703_00768 [Pseudoclavibacter triregionum]